MDDTKTDKLTKELCNEIEKCGYFPSPSDTGRKKEGKLPFLTPFYFKIKLLDRYLHDDDYSIDWYTETTGSIGHYGKWSIRFGINENEHIHMWLGDLEDLPESERARFSADVVDDNKPSFNLLRAELMCAPAELSNLTEIFRLRGLINQDIYRKYGIVLFLDKENSRELFSQICRPLYNSKDELTNSLTKVNKLFTESINVIKLKEIIKDKKGIKGKRSIKVFEIFLNENIKSLDINHIISSFYILDDFRISDTHVGMEWEWKYCLERLNINKSSIDYSQIYNKMLDSLKLSLIELGKAI